MKSFVLALRAIGSQLAFRLFVPVAMATIAVIALLVLGTLWLTSLSEWWWLLFIPITIFSCVVLAIGSVAWLLIRFVRPPQTKAQLQATARFVDKMQNLADVASTPKVIIFFRVVRSIAAPSKDSYLADLMNNRELAGEFNSLRRSFDGQSVIE